MRPMIVITVILGITNVLGYHDPDLNYHLSQVQNLKKCEDGYSYPAPAVQLTTAGVKAASDLNIVPQQLVPVAGYHYPNNGYSNGVAYQAVVPQVSYAAQPTPTYQTSFVPQAPPGYASNEVHGYATSAGLSSTASSERTVTPLATYAQAPIIAKVTAAPLIAKYSIAPAKTTYYTQNLVSQQAAFTGSLAKASLNSYNPEQSGGPVVTQVYAAPSSGYAVSPALRVQQGGQLVPIATQYAQAAPAYTPKSYFTPGAQYATSSVSYSGPSVTQYHAQHSAPVVTQYAAPAVAQYAASAVTHYSSPAIQAAPVVTQFSAPAVSQYSAQKVALVPQFATAPAVAHVGTPAVAVAAPVAQVAAGPVGVKNVHTDFLENYDAHPRYTFEYNVNSPHTGDIKQQKEERDGEVVKGQYSLVEPDGSVRTVDYVADWETGFHADVRNSKDNQH